MRSIKRTVLSAAAAASAVVALVPSEASAQQPQNGTVARDEGWGAVSHISLAIAGASVLLTPRVYYSDPQSTVGWKARYHVSLLAPLGLLGAASFFVDQPLKSAFADPRPGCSAAQTNAGVTGCESYGLISTHAFATAGFAGVGFGVFLLDTVKNSNGQFHAGSFIGNILIPVSATVVGSIARGFENSADVRGFEKPEQIAAGAIPGFIVGAALGLGYAALQRPSCPYGDALFCW